MRKISIFALAFALVAASFGVLPTAQAATQSAASVVDFNQGLTKAGAAVDASRSDPTDALGSPDGDFVSLGFGGDIELMFATPYSGSITVTVSEITNGTFPVESAQVEVSENGTSWTSVGTATNNGGADPNPHDTTLTVPADMCVQFVRLTDTTDPTPHAGTSDAFDLDAVQADGTEGCDDNDDNGDDGSDGDDTVKNSNSGVVINKVEANANTGDNHAGGSEGGDGGNGGDIGGDEGEIDNATTGNGGNGGSGSEGGLVETGDALANANATTRMNSNDTTIDRCGCSGSGDSDGNIRVHNRNRGLVVNKVEANANTGTNDAGGSEGGDGGNAGDIGGYDDGDDSDIEDATTGNGGNGGTGGVGGTVRTGRAESNSSVLNMINRSITRIQR